MSIQVKNISKRYGTQNALENVSFSIDKGELVGFLGPNGAGKSTMMKIITGYLQASSGVAFVNEEPVLFENSNIRKNIGYLPEHNPLYTDLYIKEYLELTAGFYKLKNKKKRITEIIELTGLKEEQHKKIGALSKGYRQRVGLAQALIHDPSVLILDEPTTGLDPNQIEEIRNLIRKISKEKTVLLSSHIMQEVEAVCSRIIIINKGQIVADGPVKEVKEKGLSKNQQVTVEFNKHVKKELLYNIPGLSSATFENRVWLINSATTKDIRPDIFKFAIDNNLVILTLQQNQLSLENVFQQLTK